MANVPKPGLESRFWSPDDARTELGAMLNHEYYEKQKLTNPKYLYLNRAADLNELGGYTKGHGDDNDNWDKKITNMMATRQMKEEAVSWKNVINPVLVSQMDDLLLPYLLDDKLAGFAFNYATELKFVADVAGAFLISRALRRAYYVYEYGALYSIGFGAAWASFNYGVRKQEVTEIIKRDVYQTNCHECMYLRGLKSDAIFLFNCIVTSYFVTFIQADRFKSAEHFAVNRWKPTRQGKSIVKGIFKTMYSRGGGARSASALILGGGLLLTKFQLWAGENLWSKVPDDYKRRLLQQQKGALMSVLMR